MPPELENLLKQVQIEGTLNAKEFVSSIFFTEDADYIKEFRNDFKNKFVQPLSRQLKNVKPEDLKKILDPFGISDSAESLAEDFKKYREKLKDFLNIDLPEIDDKTPKEKLKETNVSATLPDKVQETNINEQQTFGPKEILVNLNDQSKGFFVGLLEKFGTDKKTEEENTKKMYGYWQKFLENQEALLQSQTESFLDTLMKFLLLGGAGALLVSMFWDSHIKPWLEEKFSGINWDFFDKFEGIVEAMGKFFTMGGLSIGAGFLNLTFKTIGNFLESALNFVVKNMFSFGDDAAKGGGAAAGGFKRLLPSIAGNLFRGVGKVALKAVPVIGGLISFYFAYDRYQKGDYIGSLIDVVGGIANLIPGVGLPLSLGLAALNAFLDFKFGGTGDAAQENKGKLTFFKDIGSSIYGFLVKIPIIGGMIKGIGGIYSLLYSLAAGDQAGAKAALEDMTAFPLLGAIPSILLALLDVTEPTADGGSRLSLPNFLDAFKKRVGKSVLSWFSWMPTSWQKNIAEFMGVPFDGSEEETVNHAEMQKKSMDRLRELPEDAKYTTEGAKKLKQTRDDTYEAYQRSVKEMNENDTFYGKYLSDRHQKSEEQFKYLADTLVALDERIKKYNELNPEAIKEGLDEVKDSNTKNLEEMKRIREKDKEETTQVEDFYKPASGKSTLIYDQDTGKRYQTSSNDDVFALRPDGVFDKALKDIQMVAFDINKNIKNLNESITSTQKQTSPSVFNVNNSSGSGYTGKEYLMENERDAIFNDRIKWLMYSQNIRATT